MEPFENASFVGWIGENGAEKKASLYRCFHQGLIVDENASKCMRLLFSNENALVRMGENKTKTLTSFHRDRDVSGYF